MASGTCTVCGRAGAHQPGCPLRAIDCLECGRKTDAHAPRCPSSDANAKRELEALMHRGRLEVPE